MRSCRPGGRPGMAHSLVGKNERRLIGAWGYVSAARLRTGDQWAKTARLLSSYCVSPFLQVLATAAGPFRKSRMGNVVPADDAGHVWGASRVGCIGAYGDSISMTLGHLIWQLREPAGLRRRRDWASPSVDEASKFFGLQVLLLGGVRIRRMSTWPRVVGAT